MPAGLKWVSRNAELGALETEFLASTSCTAHRTLVAWVQGATLVLHAPGLRITRALTRGRKRGCSFFCCAQQHRLWGGTHRKPHAHTSNTGESDRTRNCIFLVSQPKQQANYISPTRTFLGCCEEARIASARCPYSPPRHRCCCCSLCPASLSPRSVAASVPLCACVRSFCNEGGTISHELHNREQPDPVFKVCTNPPRMAPAQSSLSLQSDSIRRKRGGPQIDGCPGYLMSESCMHGALPEREEIFGVCKCLGAQYRRQTKVSDPLHLLHPVNAASAPKMGHKCFIAVSGIFGHYRWRPHLRTSNLA